VEGDAESGLRFFDAAGCELGRDGLIGAVEEEGAASDSAGRKQEQPSLPTLSVEAARVLRTMGGRGGWMGDALIEATGLGVRAVMVALSELELCGRIQQQGFGVYAPLGAELSEEGPTQKASGKGSRVVAPARDVAFGDERAGASWQGAPIGARAESEGVRPCASSGSSATWTEQQA